MTDIRLMRMGFRLLLVGGVLVIPMTLGLIGCHTEPAAPVDPDTTSTGTTRGPNELGSQN